jgi:hypothetical protein
MNSHLDLEAVLQTAVSFSYLVNLVIVDNSESECGDLGSMLKLDVSKMSPTRCVSGLSRRAGYGKWKADKLTTDSVDLLEVCSLHHF